MIYLELVPRNLNKFIDQSKMAVSTFNEISAINVPDILRISNRSYDACIALAEQNINTIPHIRTIDFSESDIINLCHKLVGKNVSKVLLISGDPPQNPHQLIYRHKITAIIELISKEVPSIKIYGGCDPYRQSFQKEIDYCKQKIDAGAIGLFTQPIFNPHLAYMLLELFPQCEWFIGVSPVLTERSFNYWINLNKVVFPPTFNLTLDYNISIAKEIIDLTKESNQHNYLMPITADLTSYLNGIF